MEWIRSGKLSYPKPYELKEAKETERVKSLFKADLSEEQTSELFRLARQNIASFYRHCGLPAPKAEFYLLKKETKIPENDRLRLYFVRDAEEYVRLKCKVETGAGLVTDTRFGWTQKSPAGQVALAWNLIPSKNKFFSFNLRRNPVLINLASDPTSLQEALGTEALHRELLPVTMYHALREFNMRYRKGSFTTEIEPIKAMKKAMEPFIDKWIRREEGIVHALGYSWLKSQGVPEDQLERLLGAYRKNPRYAHVEPLLPRIMKDSPPLILNTYKRDPASLFKKEHLKTAREPF